MTQLCTASYRAFRPGWGQPVCTSLGLPKWRPEAEQWPRAWVLTPTWALFGVKDWDEFRVAYLARLDGFGPRKIARTLERIAREHEAERLVLLCHEGDWARCHRGLIAEYLLTRTGEVVEELRLTEGERS
ncbi:MAG: DUF488 family protein, N3 subclade [Streptosporangiaceae bacterium]